MLTRLIHAIGFGWAMKSCAFLILALLAFANATVTSRLAPTGRPFVIKAFIQPLTELPFLALAAAIFLYYCESNLIQEIIDILIQKGAWMFQIFSSW
jgi:hypothetical protein